MSDDKSTTAQQAVATVDDGTLLSWLEAQSDVHLKEWYRPGDTPGKPQRFFELRDGDDELVGQGPNLRAAILDAIGGVR